MSIQVQKMEHSPTLNTVIMVEETLEKIDKGVVTVAQLKKKLPRQVNHNTLMAILDYLDRSNKIYFSAGGITWIHNTNPKWKKAVREAIEV